MVRDQTLSEEMIDQTLADIFLQAIRPPGHWAVNVFKGKSLVEQQTKQRNKNPARNLSWKPILAFSMSSARMSLKILNLLLFDEYVLYTKARNYHWNVLRPQFNDLHKSHRPPAERPRSFRNIIHGFSKVAILLLKDRRAAVAASGAPSVVQRNRFATLSGTCCAHVFCAGS